MIWGCFLFPSFERVALSMASKHRLFAVFVEHINWTSHPKFPRRFGSMKGIFVVVERNVSCTKEKPLENVIADRWGNKGMFWFGTDPVRSNLSLIHKIYFRCIPLIFSRRGKDAAHSKMMIQKRWTSFNRVPFPFIPIHVGYNYVK